MINDREKRMEQRRIQHKQDKLVYGVIGKLITWGLITWIGVSLIWWLSANFIFK